MNCMSVDSIIEVFHHLNKMCQCAVILKDKTIIRNVFDIAIKEPYSGPEVLFKTCVAMKFVDDVDDDGTV